MSDNYGPAKLKAGLPKTLEDNGLLEDVSRQILVHPREQHIVVLTVSVGQIATLLSHDGGDVDVPVLTIDGAEWLGTILDAPVSVLDAVRARHARRVNGTAPGLFDDPHIAREIDDLTRGLIEAGTDDDGEDDIDPETGEVRP